MANLGDLLLGIKVDTSALKKVKGELSKLESEAGKIKLGLDTKGAAQASANTKSLKDEVSKLTTQTNKLKIENSALKKSYDSVANGASKLSSGTIKYTKNIKGAGKATDATQEALNKTAKTIQLIEGPLGGLAARFVTFKGIVKDNTLGVAVFTVALAGLSTTIVSAVRSFIQTEASLVKLDNTLMSTGRNFETTLGTMDKAAENLARRTLLSLQEARDGIGQALTFTNIPTDQIERFANVAADVAAGLNKDFKGSVTSIAKALQAPASALDGLGRAGQFFTKGQRQVLQSLVDTGQQAKATDIILNTLEKRFKGIGDAKGISGALDSLEIDVQLFRESIFTTTNAADSFADVVNKLGKVIQGFSGEQSLSTKIGELFSAGLRKISQALDFLSKNAETLKEIFKGLSFSLIALKVSALLKPLAGVTLSFTGAAVAGGKLEKSLKLIKSASRFLLGGALLLGAEKLNDAIFGTSDSVKGLSSLFITLKAVSNVVFNGLKMLFMGLRDSVLSTFNDMKGVVKSFATDLSSGLGKTLSEVLRDVTSFGSSFINLGVKIFKGFATAATVFLSSVFGSVKEVFGGIIDLGSAVSKVFSGDFSLAGKEATEALSKIAENNPFSALTKAATESASAVSQVFRGEGLIDENALSAKMYKFGEEGASAFGGAFEGTAAESIGNALIAGGNEFLNQVRSQRNDMVSAMDMSDTKPLLNKENVALLSDGAKKLKEIRDLAQQLSFDVPADEADLLIGQIGELRRKLAFLTDENNQMELGFKPTTKEVEAFRNKISQLEDELTKVNRKPFEKLITSAPKLDKIKNKIRDIDEELKRISDRGLVGVSITVEEVKMLQKAKDDLKKEAFELANPVIAGINDGIDQLGGKLGDNLAAKMFGEESKFSDIAKDWAKGLLGDILETIIFDPLTKDIKAAFGRLFDVSGATSGTTSALSASGAAEGSGGGFFQGLSNIFQGAFASGGSVVPNKAALVGEKGPELFIPKNSGDIITAGRTQQIMNTNNSRQNVVFNITTPNPQSFQAARGRIEEQMKSALRTS